MIAAASPLTHAAFAAGSIAEVAAAVTRCPHCDLQAGATRAVPGEGNPHARLMLVGEGPGQQEDLQGRPFVGAAGQLLEKILAAISLQREQVFIANVVKCRPPGNRTPTEDEARTCLPFLLAQIKLISPAVVVCLGATALRALVGSELRITSTRGTLYQRDGVLYIPTFHPAALLRDPSKKRDVWEDFKLVRSVLLEDMAENPVQLKLCGEE